MVCVVSDYLTLVPRDLPDLQSVSGVEARIQEGCSLSDCVMSALDCLKGIV